MRGVITTFFKGLLGVLAVTAVVILIWIGYIERGSVAAALEPVAGLVNSLRGVSDVGSEPQTTAASPQAPPAGAPAADAAAPSTAAGDAGGDPLAPAVAPEPGDASTDGSSN